MTGMWSDSFMYEFVISYLNIGSIQWSVLRDTHACTHLHTLAPIEWWTWRRQTQQQEKTANISLDFVCRMVFVLWLLRARSFLSIHICVRLFLAFIYLCWNSSVFFSLFLFCWSSHEKWDHLEDARHKIKIVRTYTINKTKVQLKSEQVAVKVLFCFILWFLHAKFSFPLEDCHKRKKTKKLGKILFFIAWTITEPKIRECDDTTDRWLKGTNRKTL